MLYALVLLLTLGWTGVSQAAMALVGGQSQCLVSNLFAGTNSYVYTYPSGITAGNLVVLGITSDTRTVSSAAGTGTTYSINGAHTLGGSGNISIWKAVAAGTDTTVTITLSSTLNATTRLCFAEFSGASSDQSGSTANGAVTSGTTTHGSGSVTPPTAENVVVAFVERGNASWTEDGAFTQIATGETLTKFAYLIQSAATDQSYDMTSDINRDAALRIGAFAGTSSGSVNFFPRRLQVQP